MRLTERLQKPSVRRALRIAAILTGLYLWAVTIVGLSFGMIDRGVPQWWLILVFGVLMAVIAAYMVSRVPKVASAAAAAQEAAPAAAIEPLSPREVEVLRQLAAGRSNREIAKALVVAPGTVKAHLHHIFRKLGAQSRLQAIAHAREAGLLDA